MVPVAFRRGVQNTRAQLRREGLSWAPEEERMTGIEPAQSAWKAETLPLSYIRTRDPEEPRVRLSWHTPCLVLTPVLADAVWARCATPRRGLGRPSRLMPLR